MKVGDATALEVHNHSFISGPRSGFANSKPLAHSHEGGNAPHQHPDCGPASYTVDRDAWRAATGLDGGGRKRYTAKPTGDQLPVVPLEDWEKSFDVVVVDTLPPGSRVTGGAHVATANMALKFKMGVNFHDQRRGPVRARRAG